MSQARELIKEIEEINNPLSRSGDLAPRDISSTDGKISHYHGLKRDESGNVVSHGPANEGPSHTHPIKELEDGSFLLEAPGESDPNDPNHTHTAPAKPEDLVR